MRQCSVHCALYKCQDNDQEYSPKQTLLAQTQHGLNEDQKHLDVLASV